MRHPRLEQLVSLMLKGDDFTITREQYAQMTGNNLPQNRKYTESKSAIARRAKELGFEVKVIPERLEFHKI